MVKTKSLKDFNPKRIESYISMFDFHRVTSALHNSRGGHAVERDVASIILQCKVLIVEYIFNES